MRNDLINGDSRNRIGVKHAPEETLKLFRAILELVYFIQHIGIFQIPHHLLCRHIGDCICLSGDGKKSYAKGIDVHWLSHRELCLIVSMHTLDDFGREESQCSQKFRSGNVILFFSKPEITQHKLAITVHHNVVRLDIPMNNVLVMHVLDCPADVIQNDLKRLFLEQPFIVHGIVEQIQLIKWHDNVGRHCAVIDSAGLHDIRVVQ
ncbi:hypothetical protein FR483_n785L [Paramecium bursaria Chlorella virus FR483]|uniref:Uncharacterized protein n785L n=1 Tax=Paramecium bursaria Chlorella virus FR483 TaxID=399781 RepID=A7J8D9_PBCVF|nr:hypothetical protein FR483_n785L [Paramecium bursaria Chlorella virus FR483]ABT16070.1 hypothetical protein FR483_n785L [Paramecium bursaria Chlorella virus FR483]